MLVISLVKAAIDYYTISRDFPAAQFQSIFRSYSILNIYRDLYYLFLSTVVWSAINVGRSRRETTEALLKRSVAESANSQLQYQFARAQNAFLKQQINPHLLFNTLNAIYSGVYLHSPKDAESVLLLSEIMRFSYEEPDTRGRVPLQSEITQVRNLIRLNTYRFGHAIRLDFQLKGDPKPYSIIPLALVTLTENMFKHGDLRLEPRSINMSVDEHGRFTFISRNVPKPQNTSGTGTHLGLSNTRLRMDYAYPDNYFLGLTQTEELFILELNINLAYENRSDH